MSRLFLIICLICFIQTAYAHEPPHRIANHANGKDYQPKSAHVLALERRAGIAPSQSQIRNTDDELARIKHDLMTHP
jgi:hypothetical protein